MTGGTVVILGPTGRNFGAGMSGGKAFILDANRMLEKYHNPELIAIARLSDPEDIGLVQSMITRHAELTGSLHARRILDRWEEYLPQFWTAFPKAAPAKLEAAVAARS